MTLEFSRQIFK